jgi:signal transduction histidine kinase
MVAEVNNGIDRASKIVKSLNQYGHARDNMTDSCDLNNIIENCETILASEMEQGIVIEHHFLENLPRILANNGKLHQVILNVLSNALHSIENAGIVVVTTFADDMKVGLIISDNGSGIKESDLPRIADPFFTTKEPGRGTGLGLYIAFTIVKEHGGEINYISKIDEGTTVTIQFPR